MIKAFVKNAVDRISAENKKDLGDTKRRRISSIK